MEPWRCSQLQTAHAYTASVGRRTASDDQPKQPSQLDIIDNRISELFDVVERIEDRLPYDAETKRSSATRRKAVKANAAE